jgi:HEAT repeat protein
VSSPSTSPVTRAAPLTPDQAPAEPLTNPAVEELMRLLAKAARAHQLYLPNNPMYRRAIDALRAGFKSVWTEMSELTLVVDENDFRVYGQVVWRDATTAKTLDSLPWLFYKDGIRELTMREGFEEVEAVTLLEMIQRARRATADDDDLVALLWEADFSFLNYRNVDLLGEGTGDEVADGSAVGQVAASDIAGGVREAVEEARPAGVVNVADFDTALYFLDPPEINYLQKELEREYRIDLRSSVTSILLDIFETQQTSAVRGEVIQYLRNLLVFSLAAGNFRAVAHLLRESKATLARCTSLAPEERSALAQIGMRLSAPEAFTQLLQALDEAPTPPLPDELADLFDQLEPTVLAVAFQWLGKSADANVRAALENAAGRLASANTSELVRLVADADPAISAEAIRRCGALKAQAAVLALGKALETPDAARRLMAAQALAEIGSTGALQSLERAVHDSERDVRMTAVRALAARAHRAALPKVEAIVKGKPIREMDLTEKMAFFESYGALCGEEGIPHCDSILNGKGFLGRREDPEMRACAAMALGRIGSPKAMECLRKAAGEKDVVVRNAVSRALRGTSAGT